VTAVPTASTAMHVKVSLKLCTGCQMCTLACSVAQTGAFNPRDAKILVPVAITGKALAIRFSHRCGTHVVDQCTFDDVPPCVAVCPTQALQFKLSDLGEET
jgi:Fe-S-cluster-containing dehydrogenase component